MFNKLAFAPSNAALSKFNRLRIKANSFYAVKFNLMSCLNYLGSVVLTMLSFVRLTRGIASIFTLVNSSITDHQSKILMRKSDASHRGMSRATPNCCKYPNKFLRLEKTQDSIVSPKFGCGRAPSKFTQRIISAWSLQILPDK